MGSLCFQLSDTTRLTWAASSIMFSGRFLVDNIKPDRTGEDLLFQVLLDWGVDLGLPIESE